MGVHIDNLRDKTIVIFGAGALGCEIVKALIEFDVYPNTIIDNNAEKDGTIVNGVLVQSYDRWIGSEKKYDYVIVSSDKYCSEMTHQLVDDGVGFDNILPYDEVYKELSTQYINQHKINGLSLHNNEGGTDGLSVVYDGQILQEQKRGGISRYFYELINGLSKREDCSVNLLAGYHISETEFESIPGKNLYYNGCKIRNEFCECPYFIKKTNELLYAEWKKQITLKNTVYHPTYYHDVGFDNFDRMVVTVHDMIHEIFEFDNGLIQDKKKIITKANHIIAVSNNTKKDLMEFLDVPSEKITVIYHGNSLRYAVGSDRAVQGDYILYVGARKGYKNAELLMRAYACSTFNNHCKLVFFGGGPFDIEEMSLIDHLGIKDSIIWLGGNDAVLANLYAHADLFVYPSKYEGFGIPILESMFYGTPVITSNVSSMPEIGGNAVEYFDPDSVDDLVMKIDYVLNSADYRAEMAKKGWAREKEFSWDKCVSQTLSLYKRISAFS